MEKRVLVALALSFLILGFYPMILQKFYPHYTPGKPFHAAASAPLAAKTAVTATPADDYTDTDDVLFKNDKLRLVFNQKGGAIREISFLDYMDSERKEPLKLISAKT